MINIPTDSLYKFCFVGGLIIFIFSYYSYYDKLTSYESFSNDINLEQVRLIEELKSIEYSTEILIDLMEAGIITNDKNYFNNKLEEIEKNRASLKIRETTGVQKLEIFKEATNEIKNQKVLTIVLMVLGAAISLVFGLLWYFKIQRIQDLILSLEYERLRTSP